MDLQKVSARQSPQQAAHIGALAALSALWDDLGFSACIDELVPCDGQTKLRPSQVMKALALNVTGNGGRDPLYRVSTWASTVPLNLILGEDVVAGDLNDDALGRHLDRFHEAGAEKVYNALCLRVITKERLSLKCAHADTTSRFVFGAYECPEDEETISITRGHSKDNRPDLKQVMYGLVTSHDGVPMRGEVLSGNTSDKTWHLKMSAAVAKHLAVRTKDELHYIGDSALVTKETLKASRESGIAVTSRLPRTFSACTTAILRAHHEPGLKMQKLGTFASRTGASTYEGVLFDGELDGVPLKYGVYRADPVNKRTRAAAEARAARALAAAKKALEKLAATPFACMADAERALDEALATHSRNLVLVTGKISTEEALKPRGRGRPSAVEERKRETRFRISFDVKTDEKKLEREIEEQSCFVLISTSTRVTSARELLAAYKGQVVVETRFPFLKDPAWADLFFVKTPRRVEAIGYVLLLALLLWTVWERRVRVNLAAEGSGPVRDTTGKQKSRPTGMTCRHILNSITAIREQTTAGDWGPWELTRALTPEQERILHYSGPIPDAVLDALHEHRAPRRRQKKITEPAA